MKYLINRAPFKVGDVVWYLDDRDESDPSIYEARVAKEYPDTRTLALCNFHRMNEWNPAEVSVEDAWHTLNEVQIAIANRLRRHAFKLRIKANENIKRAKFFEKNARIAEDEQRADWKESFDY